MARATLYFEITGSVVYCDECGAEYETHQELRYGDSFNCDECGAVIEITNIEEEILR